MRLAGFVVLLLVAALVPGWWGSDADSAAGPFDARRSYRVVADDRAAAAAGRQVAATVRARLTAACVGGRVTAGDGRVEIAFAARDRAAIAALTAPGRLAIYDREPPAGEPALRNADVRSVETVDDAFSGRPSLVLAFTSRGQEAFTRLTREVAQRGRAAGANQRFAIVLDDRVVATPFVDFRQSPDGADGAAGSQISGGLSERGAQRLAAILDSGPLPAQLR